MSFSIYVILVVSVSISVAKSASVMVADCVFHSHLGPKYSTHAIRWRVWVRWRGFTLRDDGGSSDRVVLSLEMSEDGVVSFWDPTRSDGDSLTRSDDVGLGVLGD